LASGEARDTSWKMRANKGIRPAVMASCKRVAVARKPGRRWGQARGDEPAVRPYQPLLLINIYTAPNDSQNPLASKAQGSCSTKTKATTVSSLKAVMYILNIYVEAITDSMKKVRLAGTAQPASRQYSQAISNA